MTIGLAKELGPEGVRVNAIRPGLVPTGASDPLDSDPTTREDYLAQMPLGRTGTVEDVAALVAFLASDVAASVHGAHVPIDGAQRKALMER